jgi:glycosyltransferase involved in cell wall biosynthesis
MHVLLPAWRLLDPPTGVGRVLWHLTTEVSALDPEVSFTVLHDGPQARVPPLSALSARRLRSGPRDVNFLWNEWAVPAAARRLRPDLFHNVNYTLPRGIAAPSVVTVHDISYVRHPEWFTRRIGGYLRAGTARAARGATLLTAVSEFTAGELRQVYGLEAERVVVVPNGVEERFAPVADLEHLRARYRLPERFVLHLGGIHTRRRVDRLLAACAQVLARHEAHLVLAGPTARDGWDARAAAAALGLGDRVRFLGFVPDADLPALYSAAACFAWPSVYEGFGLPPLEALACGAPTIVAKASALPEVVGEAALTVEPDNVEALAEALDRVLGDAELAAELARRGPLRAAQFSWRRAGALMLDVYRRALAAGGRP